jgi:hypothetical protein
MEAIVKKNVEKIALILLTHVAQPTFDKGGVWVVQNQYLVNVTYQVRFPFVQYACCTCE